VPPPLPGGLVPPPLPGGLAPPPLPGAGPAVAADCTAQLERIKQLEATLLENDIPIPDESDGKKKTVDAASRCLEVQKEIAQIDAQKLELDSLGEAKIKKALEGIPDGLKKRSKKYELQMSMAAAHQDMDAMYTEKRQELRDLQLEALKQMEPKERLNAEKFIEKLDEFILKDTKKDGQLEKFHKLNPCKPRALQKDQERQFNNFMLKPLIYDYIVHSPRIKFLERNPWMTDETLDGIVVGALEKDAAYANAVMKGLGFPNLGVMKQNAYEMMISIRREIYQKGVWTKPGGSSPICNGAPKK